VAVAVAEVPEEEAAPEGAVRRAEAAAG
jgi:hypothetical protein